uniref:Uncharacterized protein n=1 Tax=Pyxicephalus adspersus TaxID=30357 RepID=A0AAV3A6Q2_PYXAD|nr:TPA: hypothetical protein GDO54_013804 [Pyxicephalus adspersus]
MTIKSTANTACLSSMSKYMYHIQTATSIHSTLSSLPKKTSEEQGNEVKDFYNDPALLRGHIMGPKAFLQMKIKYKYWPLLHETEENNGNNGRIRKRQ